MNKSQKPQFIVTETFRSESEAERREKIRRIVDDYIKLKLQT